MVGRLFREGGPYDLKYTGPDKFLMKIPIPLGEDGRVGRKCPNDECSPAYYRIKPGTGIQKDGYDTAYCPYCRYSGHQSDFMTDEQIRFAKDTLGKEAAKSAERYLSKSLGLDSRGRRKYDAGLIPFEFSVKSTGDRQIRRPFEDRQRRDIVCPHCGLDHSVFGLAFWCPDCGRDIFLKHVRSEVSVVEKMLSDIERRAELFGMRVAGKDLENCLEDIVSIFEAVLKTMARQVFTNEIQDKEREQIFFKRLRNRLQNPTEARAIFLNNFGIDLFNSGGDLDENQLSEVFQKRHPITHNLGVIDRKYIERSMNAEKEGREIMVDELEIRKAIEISSRVFGSTWSRIRSNSEKDLST